MIAVEQLRIGTRGSRLARAQASLVARAIVEAGLARSAELVAIRTSGDAISATRPRGGFEASDGQFTAELQRAVAAGEVDLAVHSFKDLPTAGDEAVAVAAVLPRADARDCLASRHAGGIEGLPPGAEVGTGSARREAQLRAARPDLVARPIRGNVDTRVRRVADGEYDAVLLAAAGLDRLGLVDAGPRMSLTRLPLETMLPAPAQGALAVQVRADRADLRGALSALDHAASHVAVDTERALLVAVGGGCLAPLGALAEVDGARLRLRAAYATPADGRLRRVDLSGSMRDGTRLVDQAAVALLAAGGGAR